MLDIFEDEPRFLAHAIQFWGFHVQGKLQDDARVQQLALQFLKPNTVALGELQSVPYRKLWLYLCVSFQNCVLPRLPV